MFAFAAMITIFRHFGALKALPSITYSDPQTVDWCSGSAGLALIASLQSTDGGAALATSVKDDNVLTDREINNFAAFQMTADACITNFFSSGAVLFTLLAADGKPAVPVSLGVCLGRFFSLVRYVVANLMRLIQLRSKK